MTTNANINTADNNSPLANIDDSQFITTLSALLAWILAGGSIFTVYSIATGHRYSFKVTGDMITDPTTGKRMRSRNLGPWTVRASTGANEWTVIGHIKRLGKSGEKFHFSSVGGKLDASNPRMVAFNYVWRAAYIRRNAQGQRIADAVPAGLKVWRAHNCGRCGASLRSEYKMLGIGPECCGYVGIDGRRVFNILRKADGNGVNGALVALRHLVNERIDATSRVALGLVARKAGTVGLDYVAAHGIDLSSVIRRWSEVKADTLARRATAEAARAARAA